MPTFVDRVKQLMADKNVRAFEMLQSIGLSKSVFSDWHRGKASPSLTSAMSIAKYLGTSLDYLAFGETAKADGTDETEYSAKEKAMLDRFRKMSPPYQDRMIAYADGMLSVMPFNGDEAVGE